jgi:spoIIIJ-associated protein
MEWVETTGRTVEEAKDAALDQLGVDEQDAEFEVLAEPRGGLFGRLRAEARVRARVRPTSPRSKDDRRERRRRSGSKTEGEKAEPRRRNGGGGGGAAAGGGGRAREPRRRNEGAGAPARAVATVPERASARQGNGGSQTPREVPEMTLMEQAEVGKGFLQGLVTQFSSAATVAIEPVDDDTIRLAVEGGELGLLIGPKGQTLQAIQELVRTVVQRHTTSREGWLVVDVSQYRQKREAALDRFAKNVAEQVLQTGQPSVLEPMSPADRKVVHDAINDVAGVTTRSQGEEPRRSVVIAPDDAPA